MFDGTYTSDENDSELTSESFEETIDRMAKLVGEKLTSKFDGLFTPCPLPKIEMATTRYTGLYSMMRPGMRPGIRPEINIIESEFFIIKVWKVRRRKKRFWEKFWASLSHWAYSGCEFYEVDEPVAFTAGRNHNTIYCHPALADKIRREMAEMRR